VHSYKSAKNHVRYFKKLSFQQLLLPLQKAEKQQERDWSEGGEGDKQTLLIVPNGLVLYKEPVIW
jgi:hypothetical protein